MKFDFKWPINTVSFDGIDFGLLLKLNNILIGYKTAIKKRGFDSFNIHNFKTIHIFFILSNINIILILIYK